MVPSIPNGAKPIAPRPSAGQKNRANSSALPDSGTSSVLSSTVRFPMRLLDWLEIVFLGAIDCVIDPTPN